MPYMDLRTSCTQSSFSNVNASGGYSPGKLYPVVVPKVCLGE